MYDAHALLMSTDDIKWLSKRCFLAIASHSQPIGVL